MPNYKKAMIYKLFKIVDDKELCYIGSTTNFPNRKHLHYSQSFHKCSLLYKTIRDNHGFNTWTMEKIKDFPCDTKIQLLIEEDKCIKEYGGNLNQKRAYLTDEETRLKNLERINNKYRNDPEFRKKRLEYCKDKYENDEEYKEMQIRNATIRYNTDANYRKNTIERSKQRYLKMKTI